MAPNNRIIFDMNSRDTGRNIFGQFISSDHMGRYAYYNGFELHYWAERMNAIETCRRDPQNCIRTHNPSNCEWNAKLHACIFTKPIEPSRKLVGYNEPLTFLGLPVEFSFDFEPGIILMRKPQGLVPSSWITSINDDEEYE